MWSKHYIISIDLLKGKLGIHICRDASRTKNLTLLMKEGHCMHGPADL